MRKLLNAGFCLLLTIIPGRAQVAEERPFLREAAQQLNAYAKLCIRNGFPGRARETWLEVISEYDTDDAEARESLGFTQVGTRWAPIRGFEFPQGDAPDVAVSRSLQRRWEDLTETLGEGHRELALQLQALDLRERAEYHFNRTLRFLPSDPAAAAARGLESFEGFFGTADQVTLLRRSRLMERTVERLTEKDYHVELLPPDATHPWLKRAGVGHIGVKSEHFTVWGDFDEDLLFELARYSERALEFCREVFAGYEGFPPAAGFGRTMIHLQDRETMVTVLKANRHVFGRLADFLIQYEIHSTMWGAGSSRVFLSGYDDVASNLDVAVRRVAESYSGFRSDGLREGIGHAVVGKFFGRILVFTIGPDRGRGTASGPTKFEPLMPDLASWAEQSLESAWQRSSTKAAMLPLIEFASFPEDGRLKAWSFCDYLLRRDPGLLLALDQTPRDGARHQGDVIQKFHEATGASLPELDDGWRRFWTEDTPLNRAVHNKQTPLEATSSAAPAWLRAFNELRVRHGSPEVLWSSRLSVECKQHAEYLKANRSERGDGAENTQQPGSEGFSSAGRAFAQTAIVNSKGTNPRAAMKGWIDLPGYRNAILSDELGTIGLYVDGPIAVLDVERGVLRPELSASQVYPSDANDEQNPAPRALDVKLLGAEIEGLVRRKGGRRRPQIGYPISMHFYRGQLKDVQCTVSVAGEQVEGFLHRASDSTDRRIGARGMWVFYPFEPLRRGVEIRVGWSYVAGGQRGTFDYMFVAN